MTDRASAGEYKDREILAVRSVIIEIGQILGTWRDKFVIVGGSVPWLLLPNARPQHIGTLDIDIALDPDALRDSEYARLVEALEQKGYERDASGLRNFQLRRLVDARDGGDQIAVLIDLMMPKAAAVQRSNPKLIANLQVIRADGCEFALSHNVSTSIEGRMPDDRPNRVNVLVATIPAFLVMKGYALVGRDKMKDAYDIYFAIRNFEGGTQVLAEQCATLLSNPNARIAFEHIASKFRKVDDFGPTTVRRFVTDSNTLGDMTPEQVQTDAHLQVSAWVQWLLRTS